MKRLSFMFFLCLVAIFVSSIIVTKSYGEELYRVGVNDVIQITVLDNDELKTLSTVSVDGTITFPFIGTVHVKDKTLSEIEEEITKRLSEGYVKYPVVSVSLVKSKQRRIYTYGEVNRRGELPFIENMTVSIAMSLAGGVSKDGLYGKLKVRRKQANTLKYRDIIEIDLNNGIINNKEVEDMLLQPDDILVVERSKTFFIHGEVVKVGQFILEKDMTIVRALSVAGGIRDNGLYGKVKLRRKQKGATGYKEIVEVDLNNGVIEDRKVEDMLLQPDDVLIVERNKTFFIHGDVVSPGQYVLEKNMTVERALSVAGGIRDDGLYGKVRLRRKQEGTTEYKDVVEADLNNGIIDKEKVADMLLQPDDILIVERSKTFFIYGEIMKVGQFAMEKDMTIARAISVAGGIRDDGLYGKVKLRRKQEGTTEYKDVVETDLNNGAISNKEIEDMLLQPDDIVIIERNKTFFIYGEVNRPGEYVLKNDMTVFNAISVAGGFNKWGSPDRVEVLRVKDDNTGLEKIKVHIDDVIKGDASKDVLLKAGDTIVVLPGVF